MATRRGPGRVSIAMAGLLVFPGCTDRSADLEHQTRRARAERETLAAQLKEEQARSAATREMLEQAAHERDLNRAEAQALRDRVEQLERAARELKGLIEEDDPRELRRPEIVAVKLPAQVDQALVELAQEHSQAVSYDRARGAVKFKNDLLFDSASDVLRPDSREALRDLAGVAALPEAGGFEVVVVGHTDDLPITRPETVQRHPSNWHLSVHRAIAVKNALVDAGLPENRVAVMGYGAQRPMSSDRAQNRRVEILLAPRSDLGSSGSER